jgi:hypothetical protein
VLRSARSRSSHGVASSSLAIRMETNGRCNNSRRGDQEHRRFFIKNVFVEWDFSLTFASPRLASTLRCRSPTSPACPGTPVLPPKSLLRFLQYSSPRATTRSPGVPDVGNRGQGTGNRALLALPPQNVRYPLERMRSCSAIPCVWLPRATRH